MLRNNQYAWGAGRCKGRGSTKRKDAKEEQSNKVTENLSGGGELERRVRNGKHVTRIPTCNDECPLLPVDRRKFQEIAPLPLSQQCPRHALPTNGGCSISRWDDPPIHLPFVDAPSGFMMLHVSATRPDRCINNIFAIFITSRYYFAMAALCSLKIACFLVITVY